LLTGEALNIDLSDFINYLYTLIPPLGISPDIEQPSSTHKGTASQSPSDMLFRALNLAFSARSSASGSPSWRSTAFAKRLLTAALNWPPSTAVRAIEFVGRLIVRDNKLEALLSTNDRSADGIYRADVDDPQLCQPFGTSFWELLLLENGHYDKKVQEAARKVLTLAPNTGR
jgi:nucleolar complex protein 3